MDWSPDGSFIVFEGLENGTDGLTGVRSIYRVGVETGIVTQLTFPDYDGHYRPIVSPDNTEILSGGTPDGVVLYRIPAVGGSEVQISPYMNMSLAAAGWGWSPDGSEIVHITNYLENGNSTADAMVGKILRTTTDADYNADLRIVGRTDTGGGSVIDRHSNWRP